MLKITRHPPADGQVTLVVEGRLVGAWIGELERVAAEAAPTGRLIVDVGGVHFADREGAALLSRLRDAGAEIAGPSPFVAALMGGGR